MKPRHKKPSKKEVGMAGWGIFSKNKNPKTEGHKEHQAKNVVHDHGEPPPEGVPIYTIAVILDDEVYEVLRAQEKLGDIFLATPKFVLVDEETGQARIGMDYVDGKFREKQ